MMTNFSYNPADANPLLPDGEYDGVVFEAKRATTKSGDPKLQITVKAYGPNSVQPPVTDHIVAPWGVRRLRQLCKATDVNFDSGEVNPADFVGKNLRVRLRVRKDESGEYDDQNEIKAYLPDAGSTASMPTTERNAPAPDDHPLDEAAAFATYVKAVKEIRPDASDEMIMQNFSAACDQLVPGKARNVFTTADWQRVVAEGPGNFIPF